MGSGGMYSRVEDTSESREALPLPLASPKQRLTKRSLFGLQVFLFVGAVTFFVMLYKSFAFGAVVGCVSGAVGSASKPASHDIPQYYQTKPELFAGQYIHQVLLDQILMLLRSNSNWCCSVSSADQSRSFRGCFLYPQPASRDPSPHRWQHE
jgi:hypothetical protein